MGLPQHEHSHTSEACTGKAEPDIFPDADKAEEGDTGHDGEGSTRIDAQKARFGQRIARQRLHQRTGYSQRKAGEERNAHARQAQGPDDQMQVVLRIIPQQGLQNGSGRHGARAGKRLATAPGNRTASAAASQILRLRLPAPGLVAAGAVPSATRLMGWQIWGGRNWPRLGS